MKLLTAFSLLFFLSVQLHAQDTIHKNDGSIILAKVLEVGTSVIKYKRANNLDGPNYTIYKSEVQKIVYANGEREVFHEETKEETVVYETNFYEENVAKDHYEGSVVMGQDLWQFYYRNFSFFVEIRPTKVFAMRFSFYINFKYNVDRESFPLQHGFSIYPHFNFYNNKYLHVFLGPHFYHGLSRKGTSYLYDDYFSGNQHIFVYEEDIRWRWHNMFMIEPGISINPVEGLDITLHGGAGFDALFQQLDPYDSNGLESDINFVWKFGLTIGGRW